MMSPAKRISLVTPVLTFRHPKLTEPDYGSSLFPKPDGEYSVQGVGRVADPALNVFVAKLKPLYDKAVANADVELKKLPLDARKKFGSVKPNDLFTILYDKETEEPTGEIAFKFIMKASGMHKRPRRSGPVSPSSSTRSAIRCLAA